MRRAGAVGRGECGERSRCLGEIALGCGEDAVVVDGRYVGVGVGGAGQGAGRGLGLGAQQLGLSSASAVFEQKLRRVVNMAARRLGGRVSRLMLWCTARIVGSNNEVSGKLCEEDSGRTGCETGHGDIAVGWMLHDAPRRSAGRPKNSAGVCSRPEWTCNRGCKDTDCRSGCTECLKRQQRMCAADVRVWSADHGAGDARGIR